MDGAIGLGASVVATTAVHPIDVIKSRFQLSRTKVPLSVKSVVGNVWTKYGIRGFNRGLSPNLCTYPVFWCVYFQTNKYPIVEISDKVYVNRFVNSFIAANVASTFANPLFVIKTRLQTNGQGLLSNLKSINGYGVKGYFRGLPSTCLKQL